MMTDDELAGLAADIKANGLIHPIVTDAAGVVIDGRNRLRACEIAGVDACGGFRQMGYPSECCWRYMM